MGKRLQLLKDTLVRPTRMAHLFDTVTTAPRSRSDLRRLFETSARGLHMEPLWHEVHDASELESGFRALSAQQTHAVVVGGSPLMFQHVRRLAELAVKYHMPATYEARAFVEAGGLMAYGVDLEEVFARGAVFVDKILRGAKPAVLPIEQPTKFEFVINLKAAKAIGITIPPSVLGRADEVIQ
jgi:putative ABC transport system substrate-binding protein